jgi:hypothetical protein
MSAESEYIRQAVDDRTALEDARQAIVDEAAAKLLELAQRDYRWQRWTRACSAEAAHREASDLVGVATGRIDLLARDEFTRWYLSVPSTER